MVITHASAVEDGPISSFPIPLLGSSHRDRKQNGGYQGLERGGMEELMFNRYRVSILDDEKFWKWVLISYYGSWGIETS